MTHADARFEVQQWDETPYEEYENGAKLTRAVVQLTYHGAIEGESKLQYLMAYPGDMTTFVGLERIVGRLGERSGSFVIQHTGTDQGGVTTSNFVVVPGSGTGDLRGLRGQGSYTLHGHATSYPLTLDYDFENAT